MISTLNLTLAVLALPIQDLAFSQFSGLNGHRWAMTLQLGEMREYVLSDYVYKDSRLISKSAAQELTGPTKWINTTFTRQADGTLKMEQLHEGSKWVGTASATGNIIVFHYGPEDKSFQIRDEFRWIDTNLAKGELFMADGKKVGSYTMRKVEAGQPSLVLGGLDPVSLSAGKQRAGKANVTATYNRWTYQFESATNRARFLKSPAQYAVQFDGACMNMGPLSGRGGATRFAVHKGHIYLFASDSCLASFQKAPDDFIDKPDLPLRATPSELRAGEELLEKAAVAHGGKALDDAKSISWQHVSTYDDRGETKKLFSNKHLIGRSTFVEESAWDDILYRDVATEKFGWSGRLDQPFRLEASELAFMKRKFLHNPIVILKNRKYGLQAKALGKREGPNGQEAIAVQTYKDGSATTLYIDPITFRVNATRYVGRARTAVNEITETFDNWKTVQGITLPSKTTRTWVGKEKPEVTELNLIVDQVADSFHWVHPLTKFP